MGGSASLTQKVTPAVESADQSHASFLQGGKLLEAMTILQSHPILRDAFFKFFQSGRWINQFLSSNPNLASSGVSNISQFLAGDEVSLFSTLFEKSLDVHESMTSFFLASSFPIFMQSTEFQLWLETFDDEEEALEKEVIHMKTMDYRRYDERQHNHQSNLSDDEDELDTRPIYSACATSSLSPSLKLRHRRKSHVSCDPYFIRAETDRMTTLIDSVLELVDNESLQAYACPQHWIHQMESTLNEFPYPVIIARSKVGESNVVSKLFNDQMRIVAVNEAYTHVCESKNVVGRRFADTVLANARIVSQENIVKIGKNDFFDQNMEGLYPVQVVLESTKRCDTMSSSALFVKPVHHVLADPKYNYIVAVWYDLSSPRMQDFADSPVSQKLCIANTRASFSSKRTDISSSRSAATGVLNRSTSSIKISYSPPPSALPRRAISSKSTASTETAISTGCNALEEAASCFSKDLMDQFFSAISTTKPVPAPTSPCSHPLSSSPPSPSKFSVVPSSPYSNSTSAAALRQLEKDMPVIEDMLNMLPLILY